MHFYVVLCFLKISESSENCLNADPQQRCRHNNQWRHQQAGHDLTSLLGLPETSSTTCLDLQAQEVQDTRKMRDDSKIHHIIDDSMFKPRKMASILLVILKSLRAIDTLLCLLFVSFEFLFRFFTGMWWSRGEIVAIQSESSRFKSVPGQ